MNIHLFVHAWTDVAPTVGARPDGCCTLYVTGLPYDTDEDAVLEAFK